ncbi:MDR family MFS transporter [Lacticaseibacillus saniviri]|uniref:MFS superfamily EmrB QacA family protein n=1 Tax=Lacticaseibacillus saniviri JCM 17471 = DSM 24301 TaxID=1293598 RepID=A0A0R2MXN9_9LACO|nr:MDR family MFS transporter [Lacticaseibacillus saniviri]KRO18408.1 MFS superfamily EmrB QacA family protein [Lacticaseibacillus saniviri JCM 17471 = DSM 24301]
MQVKDVKGNSVNVPMMVITLITGVFITVLNQTILATAFPTLMKAFDISTATVQWLTTGFLMVNGIMIPVSAYLSTKFPTKWLYITAMSTFLLGTVIAFVANSFEMLLIGRLVQALGVGVTMPLLQNIMLTIFPPAQRGRAMGLSGIAIGVAPAIGPTLSGWVIDNSGWRTLFGMIIPIAVLVIIMSFFFMKSVLPNTNPKIDIISLIESTLGFGSLLYGLSEVGNKGWGDPIVLIAIALGIVVIALFGYRQLHLETPFLEVRVFKNGTFTLSTILGSIANMAMVGAEMVIPMYLQIIHGKSALESGLTLLPGALMMGLMSPITGTMFDRIGAKRLAQLGLFFLTVATIPYAFVTASTPSIYITVLYAVRMFGVSMVMMPVTTNGMNALSTDMIRHGTAVNNTVRQVATSMTTAILVSVLTNVTNQTKPASSLLKSDPLAYKNSFFNATLNGYHAAFWFAVGFSLLGWLLTFFLRSNKKSQVKIDIEGGKKA